MRKSNSKLVIPDTERRRYHLVVCQDTHDAVIFYARKKKVTITEATQRLLTVALEKEIDANR